MLAISTLLDPRIKKLTFSDSAAVRKAEQWVVQEMSGHVQTNDSNEDRQPSITTEAAGLWDLFDSVVKQSTSQRIQPVMQHWKLESILKNQCWQDSKIPYCSGRRMSDTMNLSQKLRRSIFASLVNLFPPKECSLK